MPLVEVFMRRSTLLFGIVAALVIGGTTVYLKDSNTERERAHHIVLVRNNALCEKTLEIAVSFSSYNSDTKFLKGFQLANNWASYGLNNDYRQTAYKLGFSSYEYDAILMKARYDAEKVIIPQINNASNPAAKAYELAEVCTPSIITIATVSNN